MFIFGFITGIVFVLVFFLVAYVVIKELIVKCGQPLNHYIHHEINQLSEKFKDNAEIIFPDDAREIFENENTTLADQLK